MQLNANSNDAALLQSARDLFDRHVVFCASIAECTQENVEFCRQIEQSCAFLFKHNVREYHRRMNMICELLRASYRFNPVLHTATYPPNAFATMTTLELVNAFLPPSHLLHTRITYANTLLGDENGQTDMLERQTLPPLMAEVRKIHTGTNVDVTSSDMAIHATLRQRTFLDEACPNCGKKMLMAIMQQTRSGDEGQTLGKRCANSTCDWSEVNID